jgi:hypothetical protein
MLRGTTGLTVGPGDLSHRGQLLTKISNQLILPKTYSNQREAPVAVAHALAALIAAYLPLRLACTAFLYSREQGLCSREQGSPRDPSRWTRAADWITRHPNLFPVGSRFLASPAALCLLTITASGATRLLL